ncbi:MAG: hypothetical protein Q9184_004374, partial [Pyrenodesmia sp. 2 TL-2023]
PKIFEWTHVKDWANVRDYELPLRQNSDLSELPRKQVDYYDMTDDEVMEIDHDEAGGMIKNDKETREALELLNRLQFKMTEEEEEAFTEGGVIPSISRI